MPDVTAISAVLKDDLVRPFQIDRSALRGRLSRLGPAIDTIIAQHGYPEPVARLLGEAAAMTLLLAGALKYEGVFTLQAKGNGPVRLLVADVTSGGNLRAYAQFDAEALAALGTIRPGNAKVPRLLGEGYLAFTVDQGEHTERYQGIVELQGVTLAECAQHYFTQSEQIDTGIFVSAAQIDGTWRAGGIMIQRLPPENAGGAATELTPEEEDAWQRAMVLMASCTPAEMTDASLPPDTLLFRLFHEDGVRVYPALAVQAQCRCSPAKIENVLRSIPQEELEDLKVDGEISVTCEFCGTRYGYDSAALEALNAG